MSDPNPDKTTEYSDDEFKNFRDFFKNWTHADAIQASILVVGAIYCVVTIGLYCANKKAADAAYSAAETAQNQTALLRQQVSGTLAAAIPLEGPVPEPIPNDLQLLNYTGIVLSFRNLGKIRAKDFSADATMTRKKLPDYKVLGHPQRRQISQSEVRPYEQIGPHEIPNVTILKFETGEFSGSDITLLHNLGEIVEINGHFQYDNGFEEVVSKSICLVYASIPQHRFENGNAGAGGHEGWFTCEDGGAQIEQALQWNQKH